MKRILWWMVAGTKGGVNRARIIMALRERPYNAHQLTELLKLDYSTIRFHLNLMIKNQIVVMQGGGYGSMYFLSDRMDASYGDFMEIIETLDMKSQEVQ